MGKIIILAIGLLLIYVAYKHKTTDLYNAIVKGAA